MQVAAISSGKWFSPSMLGNSNWMKAAAVIAFIGLAAIPILYFLSKSFKPRALTPIPQDIDEKVDAIMKYQRTKQERENGPRHFFSEDVGLALKYACIDKKLKIEDIRFNAIFARHVGSASATLFTSEHLDDYHGPVDQKKYNNPQTIYLMKLDKEKIEKRIWVNNITTEFPEAVHYYLTESDARQIEACHRLPQHLIDYLQKKA